jgi:hypothetical protein
MALAVALAAATTLAAPATAAPEPGPLVPTTSGVPGHGRAWELVTPGPMGSAVMWGFHAVAEDGDRVGYAVSGQLPGSSGAPRLPPAIAVRGANGWTSIQTPVPNPELVVDVAWPLAFDANLTRSIQPDEFETILHRGRPEGPFEPLVELEGEGPHLLATSADLGHVVFRSAKHYLPADAERTEGQSLYEIDGSELRLVDVDDDGALISNCGLDDELARQVAISSDGGRIFFGMRPCANGGPSRAYLREGGETTEISASQCDPADCDSGGELMLAGITPSGSSAVLRTYARLTNEDLDDQLDLYQYDVADRSLTLLSGPLPGMDASTGFLKIARDGSRSYFSAVPEGTFADDEIYVTGNGDPRRVPGAEFPSPEGPSFDASDDARYLVYATEEALVGSDTDTVADIYRYDAETDKVTLISIGPAGGNGPIAAALKRDNMAGGRVIGRPFRFISSDGGRIFFTTAESLLAQDRNGVDDVYEWADGNLTLISSGTGAGPSAFLGVTPDGSSVFFATNDTLLAQDRDGGLVDYYVARVGGGFASPAPECDRMVCPAPAQERLRRVAPASAETTARGIQVRRLGAAERRRAAATGRLVLLVEAPGPGRLSAAVRARIGSQRRTVAAASALAAEAGPVELRLRLAKAARRSLAQGHRLNLRVLLRAPQQGAVRRLGIALEAPR